MIEPINLNTYLIEVSTDGYRSTLVFHAESEEHALEQLADFESVGKFEPNRDGDPRSFLRTQLDTEVIAIRQELASGLSHQEEPGTIG